MSEKEEYNFLLDVLIELQQYPNHHEGAIQQIIEILKYRLDH